MRHAIPYNHCWYSLITKKAVRENPDQFKAADVGRYLIRECVDLFEQGDIVSKEDIDRQIEVWKQAV